MLLQEKQNATQQHEPNQSNMTPSVKNNELIPKSTTPQVKSTHPSPKNAYTSSNFKDKTEHTSGNVEGVQATVNGNEINQNIRYNEAIKKVKSAVVIEDSRIKHTNG